MSTLSLNTQFTLISLLLLINTSNVHARDCVRVSVNEVDCGGMTAGASAGIAIGSFVLFMSLISIIFWWRWRRRLYWRRQIYISDPNANGAPQPQPQVSQVQIQPSQLPAFPQQAYGQQAYEGVAVENKPQFASPAGPPPV